MKKFFYFVYLLLAVGLTVSAQEKLLRFDHLGTHDGLSQSNVLCILQDSRGFMWFGTRDGLNKYDGYKFTVYKNDPRDPLSLSNNFINSIIEAADGNLWIATLGGGLSMFDRDKKRFVNYRHDAKNQHSISSDLVTSVFQDSYGFIWAGTEKGLNIFDPNKRQFLRYMHRANDDSGPGHDQVKCVFEDSDRDLWIGTGNGGLDLFNRGTKRFKNFRYNKENSQSISSNDIKTVFEDSKGRLWIGTNNSGLDLFNKKTGEFTHFKHDQNNSNSVAANSIFSINEDDENNLWIGTENGGLSILNAEKKQFYTYQNDVVDNSSLSCNSIYKIYKDRKGDLWLGTFNRGIDVVRADAGKFTHYKHVLNKNSLSNNNVLCIYEDSKNNIWIGTDGGGLNLFDPKTGRFTVFDHKKNDKNSICGHYVLSVCEDSKGNIWVGTWADGITVFDPAKKIFRHYKNDPKDPSSLSNNNGWKIFEDKAKNIWIGTFGGGLNLFDPDKNTFTSFKFRENDNTSLSNNNVQSIFEDSDGILWVSTDGGGLNQFDRNTKKFKRYLHNDKENSVINNSLATMHEDRNKNLWIGTMAGLSCLDKKANKFINYTTANGLPNDIIFGIMEDDTGNIWVSTSKGVSRFDPVARTFKNFDVSDGLQSNEFTQKAFCKSSDGTMYFGGNNGFNRFSPADIKDNSFEPHLVFTGFQIFNKEVPIAGNGISSPLEKDITETTEITIPYKSSVISFEFASLNYTISEKKQYEYILEGFDEKWNNIGTRRTATYTNLNPGTYTFRVRGLNNDGSWSNRSTALKLIITPPFWMTWWFRSLCALFVLGCFFVFYRLRVRTITRQKIQLEKQVKERTDQIVMQKEVLTRNLEELAALKEDLQVEKYYLDSLMNYMPDAIYFKDKESRFIRVSKYMVRKHVGDHPGATESDLLGKTDFDLQDKAHAKEAFADEQEIQRTGKPKIDYIEKEIAEDGSDRWVATTKLPMLNAHGEVVGTFGISRDVTKIRTLEKQQHEAMVDKAVAQGKFEIASEVMHDIGNAISGFRSYLDRMKRLQDNDGLKNLRNLVTFFNDQKTSLEMAIGETKAAAVIQLLEGIVQTQDRSEQQTIESLTSQLNIVANIEDILNIQRKYISGYESKERKPAVLKDIINDSLSMFYAIIANNSITVTLNIAPDIPSIKGDRTKLMQLMINLLKNSIEATEQNKTARNININAYMEHGKLMLQVADNGRGFDPAMADKLFQRGFSTKHNGTGFGLYDCRTIVESHEGIIGMSSEGQGKGAIITIAFTNVAA
jgi:PAS domain S-box-containing protein